MSESSLPTTSALFDAFMQHCKKIEDLAASPSVESIKAIIAESEAGQLLGLQIDKATFSEAQSQQIQAAMQRVHRALEVARPAMTAAARRAP